MNIIRVILAIIFPPLAVIDKGCGSFIIVTILSCLGWIPGVLAALVIVAPRDQSRLEKELAKLNKKLNSTKR